VAVAETYRSASQAFFHRSAYPYSVSDADS
jgi:hypothetical protein